MRKKEEGNCATQVFLYADAEPAGEAEDRLMAKEKKKKKKRGRGGRERKGDASESSAARVIKLQTYSLSSFGPRHISFRNRRGKKKRGK